MEQGLMVIDLRLNRVAQLFNTFDPSPFHERDLDDDAEAYIVACAREITHRHKFKLVIHLPPEEAAREDSRQLEKAVNLRAADKPLPEVLELIRAAAPNLNIVVSDGGRSGKTKEPTCPMGHKDGEELEAPRKPRGKK